MAIFRQYIAPLIVVFIFLLSLVAVSARIFLPQDMAAPAPIEDVDQASGKAFERAVDVAGLPASLDALVRGLSPVDTAGMQL
ncbi:MAG: hypothetical protein KME15_26275 [Drouetiella hepatica Uher 2000/2452]|jgi:hypothetical protein|uniref:Uncharacterized protein n=1 Tax=Drouetiella hepatica Uher 2000/2452 TaxID=904376 RepID=A0A951QI08_9CYAN|nr:hypothetical protein [Drouetiella hepatica Uher 2000/2452]